MQIKQNNILMNKDWLGLLKVHILHKFGSDWIDQMIGSLTCFRPNKERQTRWNLDFNGSNMPQKHMGNLVWYLPSFRLKTIDLSFCFLFEPLDIWSRVPCTLLDWKKKARKF